MGWFRWKLEEESFMHHTCKLYITSKKKLGQAERRKNISNLNDCVVDIETESCHRRSGKQLKVDSIIRINPFTRVMHMVFEA